MAVFLIVGGVVGAGEGVIFWTLDRLGLTSWQVTRLPIDFNIVWASALAGVAAFGLAGLVVTVVTSRMSAERAHRIMIGVALFLMVFSWLAIPLSGRLHDAALGLFAAGVAVVGSGRVIRTGQVGRVPPRPRTLFALAVVLALAVVIAPFLAGRVSEAAEMPPVASCGASDCPSVLLVVVDALRADHLTTYAYHRETSPAIDSLARSATTYENAIATSAWTVPSHASLLSGLYPAGHGVNAHDETAFADLDAPVLAEEFASRGFRTGAFSANLTWFTAGVGFGRGFHHFDDIFHSTEDALSRTIWGRMFDRYVAIPLGYRDVPGRKLAADVTDSFIEWVERDPTRPFLAVLNYFDVHDPYLPPAPYDDLFGEGTAGQGLINWRLGASDPELRAEEVASEIDAYDGAIRYVDDEIRRLLARMDALDLADDLVVVVTSDHGEAFGEHGLYLHAHSLNREVIHVPLVLQVPGVTNGERVATPASIAWIPATLFQIVFPGGRSPFPGPVLPLTAVEDSLANLPSPIAQMAHQPWLPETYPIHHSALGTILTERWQAIIGDDGTTQLFEWQTDLAQADDRARRPENQPTVDSLTATYRSLARPRD